MWYKKIFLNFVTGKKSEMWYKKFWGQNVVLGKKLQSQKSDIKNFEKFCH